MPDFPGIPSTTRCAACGFENTSTSLYCQDCGMRLVAPPSAIAAESSLPAKAAVTPVRSSPRILSARRSNRVRSYLTITIRTIFVAALAALIIQILRPSPDFPPTETPLAPEIVNNVHAALQLSAQRGAPFDAPWRSLNAYLAAVLQPGPGGPFHTAFERALLGPSKDGFALFVQRKVLGLPLSSRIDYRLVTRGSGIEITPVRAAFGRLRLPAWMAPAIESLNGGLEGALASDLEILRQTRHVRITPQKASVDFAAPPP